LNRYKEIKGTATLLFINVFIAFSFGFLNEETIKFALTSEFQIKTIFSSMFIHGDIIHLFFNMFALFFLGSEIEKRLNTNVFLIVYFLSGIAGSIFTLIYLNITHENSIVIGASGAIFGLFAFLSYFKGYSEIKSFWINVIIFHVIIITLDLHIAWHNHFGGIIAGIILSLFLVKKTKYSF